MVRNPLTKNKRKSSLNLKIFTFNTQGLPGCDRLPEFEEKVEKLNFNIIGMSETRIFGEKLIKKRDVQCFFTTVEPMVSEGQVKTVKQCKFY